MIIARVVRADGHVSIELPPGFAIDEAELSVRKDGEAMIFEPIETGAYRARVHTWLVRNRVPLDQDFIRAVEEDPGAAEERDFGLID